MHLGVRQDPVRTEVQQEAFGPQGDRTERSDRMVGAELGPVGRWVHVRRSVQDQHGAQPGRFSACGVKEGSTSAHRTFLGIDQDRVHLTAAEHGGREKLR